MLRCKTFCSCTNPVNLDAVWDMNYCFCLTCRSYIANRVTDKLTPITDKIYCCRSGSAADTQAIADIVKYQLDIFW